MNQSSDDAEELFYHIISPYFVDISLENFISWLFLFLFVIKWDKSSNGEMNKIKVVEVVEV